MKKFLVPLALCALIFNSCKTSQISSYQDDIYTSPSEEKRLARIAAEERAKKDAIERQKQEEVAASQKAKDEANPYYQDPQYNTDDYYDYKYASQISRFNNPVYGAGYYDNYYTNSYSYNQNPYSYGSSIYSSYNWMPSNQFYGYSNSISVGFSTGNYYNSYGGYNSYGCGYGSYYNNGFCGSPSYGYGYGYPYYGSPYYGYNPYMAGYNAGYNNGFYNGSNWGYYNSYDVNSAYSHASYGPRGSNGGNNGGRPTAPKMQVPEENSARSAYINQVAAQQENTPRFTDVPRKKITEVSGTNYSLNGQSATEQPKQVRGSSSENTMTGNETKPVKSSNENTGFWPRLGGNNSNATSTTIDKNPGRNTTEPVYNTNTNTGGATRNTPSGTKGSGVSETYNIPPANTNSGTRQSNVGSSETINYGGNSNSNSGGNNSNSGSSSTPRGSSGGNGGGSQRPR